MIHKSAGNFNIYGGFKNTITWDFGNYASKYCPKQLSLKASKNDYLCIATNTYWGGSSNEKKFPPLEKNGTIIAFISE